MSATKITVPTSIAIVGVTVGLLAGCGGSSSPKATTEQGRATPTQSGADIGQTVAQVSHTGRPAAQPSLRGLSRAQARGQDRVGPAKVERATPTPTKYNDDARPGGDTQFNPCSLVSVSQAQTILGGSIAGRFEAPLGPTCVYKLGGSKPEITLAVETLSLTQAKHEMTQPEALSIGTRQAYCGRLGRQMLFARVSKGEVLNVAAPCAIAKRFATLALTRLAA